MAHSDVAPSRKQDPGEKFPWQQLAQSGVGLWVEPRQARRQDAGARRHRRQGARAAEGADRIRLRPRGDRPLRRAPPARSSPPSSAISARRGSTASSTPRPGRRCASSCVARNRAAAGRPRPSPLDAGAAAPAPSLAVSRPDGRSGNHRKVAGEESPGSTDKRCRITSGGACASRPQGQCHREQTAAARSVLAEARVKRCGKSAPRFRRRKRHGKPHREQDRIGTARSAAKSSNPCPGRRPGRLLQAPGNRRRRGMAVTREAPAARLTEPGLQAV